MWKLLRYRLLISFVYVVAFLGISGGIVCTFFESSSYFEHGGLRVWMLFALWYLLFYVYASETSDYLIRKEWYEKVTAFFQTEGFDLKSRSDVNEVYFRKRSWMRVHYIRLIHSEYYIELQVSESYVERMSQFITEDMLYGKKKKSLISRSIITQTPQS